MKASKYQIAPTLLIVALGLLLACGKKKEPAADTASPAKIAYAIYQTGVFDTTDAQKASEWLNRGEMVIVLEEVNIPDAKDPKKSKAWTKIKRTTDKVGFVDSKHLGGKAFVVISPLDVFNINQATGKKRGTVLPGQVGFVVDEKGEWAKVRFGYKVFEDWSDLSKQAWVDEGWAQLGQVSYEPVLIGQAAEFEAAVRQYSKDDIDKKEKGRADLEKIAQSDSNFSPQAKSVLGISDAATDH